MLEQIEIEFSVPFEHYHAHVHFVADIPKAFENLVSSLVVLKSLVESVRENFYSEGLEMVIQEELEEVQLGLVFEVAYRPCWLFLDGDF